MLIRFPGGGDWVRVDGDDPDRPGMHATDTLDFMVVIDGRIVLGLDDGEHELGPGDVVVQRGNLHRWRVSGDEPCTYVVCMVRPDPSGRRHPASSWRRDARPAPVDHAAWSPGRATTARRTRSPTATHPVRSPRAPTTASRWSSSGSRAAAHGPEQGGDPEGGWELEPRGGGVAFRWVRLPAGHDPGEAGWHTTATIDVDIVVSGRLELSLPGPDPVVIGPGEAVVQRGTHHKWQPVGDDAVEFVSLMLAVG